MYIFPKWPKTQRGNAFLQDKNTTFPKLWYILPMVNSFIYLFIYLFMYLPFSHLESCCSVLIGWWSPRVRKIAKSLPMKSADVPEYSSPSASERSKQLGTNDRLWIECVHFLELIKAGRDQTHRSEVRPRASWGRRGFSRGRSRNARPVERCCPAVERVRVQREANESHIKPS